MNQPVQTMRDRAQEKVLIDLINALFYEDFLHLRERQLKEPVPWQIRTFTLKEGEDWFLLRLDSEQKIAFRVGFDQRYQMNQIRRLPVLLIQNQKEEAKPLGATEVMCLLCEKTPQTEFPNQMQWEQELNLAVEQTALSFEEPIELRGHLSSIDVMEGERFASLRDRPFHPTSRVKNGWNSVEYQMYSPEFGQPFRLNWVAVRRENLDQSDSFDDSIPKRLLTQEEQEQLQLFSHEKGISEEQYAWLPVHPWQLKSVIPQIFAEEWKENSIIPLTKQLGTVVPSSSVRTVIPIHNPYTHIKLPLGIFSLGALRILPSRYLANGEKGQRLMEKLGAKDAILSRWLWICDESQWITYNDLTGDPFADKPGFLGCLIRLYPQEIHPDDIVLPMSAFSVYGRDGKSPLIERLMQISGKDAATLFSEISQSFIEMTFALARYGVMPELHGQNVVLQFREGKLKHLILRDHDTVRIFPDWMQQAGVKVPSYTIKPNTRNTLILKSLEDFLSYFQTLAVQVNLSSIVEAFDQGGYIPEADGWKQIRKSIEQSISLFPTQRMKEEVDRILFAERQWPVKTIITPFLTRVGSGGGSMPSGQGKIANPLL